VNQLVILIIFGVIALANYYIKKSREDAETFDSTPPPPIRRPPAPQKPIVQTEPEEERMRRFMEALGVPPTGQPPGTLQRRAPTQQNVQPVATVRSVRTVTRIPAQPVRLRQTLVQAIPPLPVVQQGPVVPVDQPTLAQPETAFPEAPAIPSEPVLLPAFATATATEPSAPARAVDLFSIRAMLQNPSTIRAAMVLREVMGPPRGLQPYR